VSQIGRYQDAEVDCTAALQGGPDVKALLRRGTARSLLGMTPEAIKDFQLVLNLEPNNS
jgi:tetratricopeptide (TPR) repeat protein